jgi:uncharacterized protein
MDISTIEQQFTEALKARNSVAVDTLRMLKTRIQNEQIAKGKPLEESDLVVLIRSEVKRRKEAAESFKTGGRQELADKELAELEILSKYLPQGPSDADITAAIDEMLAGGEFTQKDFGKLMGQLKAKFADADGSQLSGLLKAKTK